MEEEGPQSLKAGRVGGTVLSSKLAKKVYSLSGKARCRCPRRGWFSLCSLCLPVDPATYVLFLSRRIATPLCLYIPTFGLFDCLTEGITTLFVFCHIPSHDAMVKCNCFQFCVNSAIYPRFLVRVGLNSHSGYHISYTLPDKLSLRISVFVYVVLGGYPEHIPVHVIKAILKRGIRLVRPALNRPKHGCFPMDSWSDLQKGGRGRALYVLRKLV